MNIEVNKFYFENCIEVLKRLPDNSIDAFIQDPPFEVTASKWDNGFIETLPEMWDLWIKKGKKNTPFIFKATYPFAIDLINSNRKMFKYEWIWKKSKFTNFLNAKKMPMRVFEYIFVFYKEQTTYNPILRKNKSKGFVNRENQNSTKTYNIKGSYKKKKSEFGFPINFLDFPHEKGALLAPMARKTDTQTVQIQSYGNIL